MIFVHGWPALSIMWRKQLEHFAVLGYRCVAPDMRGSGKSSAPRAHDDYALEDIVPDMVEGVARARCRARDLGRPRLGQRRRLEYGRSSSRVVPCRRELVRAVFREGLRARDARAARRPQRVPGGQVSGGPMGLSAVLRARFRRRARGVRSGPSRDVQGAVPRRKREGKRQAVTHRAHHARRRLVRRHGARTRRTARSGRDVRGRAHGVRRGVRADRASSARTPGT